MLYRARDGLSRRQADAAKCRKERVAKPGLLDHIEVRAALKTAMGHAPSAKVAGSRRALN